MSVALTAVLRPAARFLLERVCPHPRFYSHDDLSLLDSISPQELADEARNQRIEGLLEQWAHFQPTTPYTTALRSALTPLQQANALRALRLVNETLHLTSLLRHHSIDALVLKGPFLAKRYYGDYSLRHPGDLDVLIALERIADADRVLRDHGYRRTKPEKDLCPKRFELYLRTQHEFGYRTPDGSISVELHWRYSRARCLSPYSFDELWRRSEPFHAGAGQVQLLSTADVLINLAVHGALDGWSKLKWLADLPRVLQALPSLALTPLLADSRVRSIHKPLALAFELARVPQQDRHGVELEAPALEILLSRIARRLQPPHSPSGLTQKIGVWWQDHLYHAHLLDTASARCEVFYTNLIMPGDFDRLSMPAWLTPALPWLAQLSRAWRRAGE